ncbi:hypothetical protein J1605_011604 [Eschrichtius robustus]|uniref:Uncharacterized protein n=1 Tax=Eschrichtius robustus TaxID=9764 RepID=A0AB34GNU6_ESCRO|nr:hypothetical protein J1605_011604 [Eschrichtius robustus]
MDFLLALVLGSSLYLQAAAEFDGRSWATAQPRREESRRAALSTSGCPRPGGRAPCASGNPAAAPRERLRGGASRPPPGSVKRAGREGSLEPGVWVLRARVSRPGGGDARDIPWLGNSRS